jgi:hypothetical protein
MPPTGSSRPRMRASLLLRACHYLPVVLLHLAASTSRGDVSIASSRWGDDRPSRRGAGGGDVFEAGRLGDAPPLDGAGGGAPDAAGGGEGGRRSNIRRRLEDVRFDGSCHESVLASTRADVANEDVYAKGLFFSVENNGTESMNISAVSVYLANTNETFDFSLYQREGGYMPLYANGTIQDMFLPGNLTVDWQSVAAGTGVNLGNFTTDEDDASLVPFESFGGSGVVTLEPGDLRSFFIVFSISVVAVDEETVDDIESIEGESPDGSVNVTEDYDGLKMYVGRKVRVPFEIDILVFPLFLRAFTPPPPPPPASGTIHYLFCPSLLKRGSSISNFRRPLPVHLVGFARFPARFPVGGANL